MRLASITPATFAELPFAARRSVWWEVPDGFGLSGAAAEFEKEAWVSAVCSEAPDCGFVVSHGGLFYCEPRFAPGSTVLASGPVSADALLISSMFIDPGFEGTGIDVVLLHAALMQITLMGYPAVEAFGYVPGTADAAGSLGELGGHGGDPESAGRGLGTADTPPGRIDAAVAVAGGFLGAQFLEDNGFTVVADDPVVPRYRLALPPAEGILSVAALTEMVAAAV